MKGLKVKPEEIPPKKSAISFRLPQPTIALFRAYLRAYAAMYGIEPDKDFITNEIFMSFFNSDKEFMLFVKENSIVIDESCTVATQAVPVH
jgi:hypothetical protein